MEKYVFGKDNADDREKLLSRNWDDEFREQDEAQTLWNEFFLSLEIMLKFYINRVKKICKNIILLF